MHVEPISTDGWQAHQHRNVAIFTIVYFAGALPIAVYVCIRQGFGRSLGWFYLLTLPVIRVAGAGCTIAAAQQARPNTSLLAAAGTLNNLGLVALLLALTALLDRCNAGMYNRFRYALRGIPIAHILSMVTVGCSISGGTNSAAHDTTGVRIGHILLQTTSMILLVVYLICLAVTAGIISRIGQAWEGDRLILHAAAVSFPFLLVRLVYTIIIAFATGSSAVFNLFTPNVYASLFMQNLMDCVVLALYLVAGCRVPPMKAAPPRVEAKKGERSASADATSNTAQGQDVELGTLPSGT